MYYALSQRRRLGKDARAGQRAAAVAVAALAAGRSGGAELRGGGVGRHDQAWILDFKNQGNPKGRNFDNQSQIPFWRDPWTARIDMRMPSLDFRIGAMAALNPHLPWLDMDHCDVGGGTYNNLNHTTGSSSSALSAVTAPQIRCILHDPAFPLRPRSVPVWRATTATAAGAVGTQEPECDPACGPSGLC